jgi:O-antigen ligase
MRPAVATKSPAKKSFAARELFALAFGLFLGLAIWKFGNPVILDQIITAPTNWVGIWAEAWPLHWANWLLLALSVVGAVLFLTKPARWPGSRWLWILPAIWFVWQLLSAWQSPYHDLTSPTLWQYAGCLACYFLGALVIGGRPGWRFILLGILAAFAFCLVRAVNQKLFEFPQEKHFLLESQRLGWTNMPPETFQEFKRENIIINTNGVDIANPFIIAKYDKGRVNGTLVYPNALAGIVLLLFPAAIVMVWLGTRNLRRITCVAAIALTIFLGLGGLFWSGSKSGWLIALVIGVFWLFRLKWRPRLKGAVAIALFVGGLVVFGVRFQSYFAKGATSVGARFDYWHVAAKVAVQHPAFGTGPGTFQRPYASMKRPESEMARLVHDDYLEQFSDSGLVGGTSYLGWIILLFWAIGRDESIRHEIAELGRNERRFFLWLGFSGLLFPLFFTIGRRLWAQSDLLEFAIFTGLLGWFIQGFTEFSLFVPALAWTAFTLAGCLLAHSRNQVDKRKAAV